MSERKRQSSERSSSINEAAIRPKDAAETVCPEVPWRDIRGIGNWLRHQYDRVDPEIIWNTIEDDPPSLKSAVQRALDSGSST